jgi:hypothetical protein
MKPIVVVDADGAEGAKVWKHFAAHSSLNDVTREEFKLIEFHGSNLPVHWRDRSPYRWYRDYAFATLLDWFKNGGAILPDLKLEAELVTLKWKGIEGGKSSLEPKTEIKKRLSRSPDRLDALMLSVFLPLGWHTPETYASDEPEPRLPSVYDQVDSPAIDPWSALSVGRRRGGGDDD